MRLLSDPRQCRRVLGLGLLLAVALPPDPAVSAPEVDLVWVDTTGSGTPGASDIQAAPGDEITLQIQLTAGPEGISSYGVSLLFDEDGWDELDLVSAAELLPAGFDFNVTTDPGALVESDETTVGQVFTFEAVAEGDGPVAATFVAGEVVFLVTGSVAEDGDDVASGFFNPGVDAIFDNTGTDQSGAATLGTAAVPEPSVAWQQVAALASLFALRCRSGCGGGRPKRGRPTDASERRAFVS